MFQLNNQER